MLQFPASHFDSVDQPRLIAIARGNAPDADAAKVALLKAHQPLLSRYVKVAPPNLREDAESAGTVGFLEALSRFDNTLGVTLGAFASMYVKGAVFRLIKAEIDYRTRLMPLPEDTANDVSAEAPRPVPRALVSEEPGFEEVHRENDLIPLKIILCEWVVGLSPDHQSLLKMHFIQGLSQSDIARATGVTRASISKKRAAILAQGKKEVKIRAFAGFD